MKEFKYTYDGSKKYADVETGEEVTADLIVAQANASKSHRGGRFYITYFRVFMQCLGIIGNKETDVLCFMLENMDKTENVLYMTQDEIAFESGISSRTVKRTIADLKVANVVVSTKPGKISINPKLINNMDADTQKAVLVKFEEDGKKQNKDLKSIKNAEEKAAIKAEKKVQAIKNAKTKTKKSSN